MPPIYNRGFDRLQTKLLLSYLLMITTILGVFSTAVYALVARDRNHQLSASLRQIATASGNTLEIIQHEYQELTTEHKYHGYIPTEEDGSFEPISLFQLMGKYQAESIPDDLVLNPLTLDGQGVEWFDRQQQLMVREGNLFSPESLPEIVPPEGQLIQQGNIRSFILPVYSATKSGTSHLLGYVRSTKSTDLLETELRQFQQKLIIGVAIVSGLVTVGGFWLTRESLKPILRSFEQLKQFTSDASHELRNPLTAIRTSIAVMQSHPERIHAADVDKLKAIASASEQMSQLVDDLLLLARMDRQVPDQGGLGGVTVVYLAENCCIAILTVLRYK
jgi:OmpR-family two-component system manganese-sensing sensor histidine kinase